MSGPQFVHIETYARSVSSLRKKRETARAESGKGVDRKLSVEEICAEAAREPGHHPHVANPKAPRVLFGVSPREVPALLEERINAANKAIKAQKAEMKRGERRSGPRGIRKDAHVVLTMVASYPVPFNAQDGKSNFDDQEALALLQQWEVRTHAYMHSFARQRGLDLVSVVAHDDEGHPHLHAIFIPANDRVDARACHPGHAAKNALVKEEHEDHKAFKRRENATYCDTMRSFQNGYFEAVSIPSGLMRTGPKRRRLPRAAYLSEKGEAHARGVAHLKLDEVKRETEDAQQATAQEIKGLGKAKAEKAQVTAEVAMLMERGGDVAIDLARMQQQVEGLERVNVVVTTTVDRNNNEIKRLEYVKGCLEQEVEEAKRTAAEWIQRSHAAQAAFALEKIEFREEMKRRREALRAKEAEVDAVLDGVEAYLDGRLGFGNAPDELLAHGTTPQSRTELATRLKPVKTKLLPILVKLDERIKSRAASLSKAISASIKAWAGGLLKGVGAADEKGRPTFYLPHDADGSAVLAVLDPHREDVATIIEKLPDLDALDAVVKAAEDTREFMAARQRADLDKLSNFIGRGNGRGGMSG